MSTAALVIHQGDGTIDNDPGVNLLTVSRFRGSISRSGDDQELLPIAPGNHTGNV
jgi:hypothetical protein